MIALWRGQLHDFIQPRPQLARCSTRVLTRRRQPIHNGIAFFEQNVALSVLDCRARQHLKDRAGQLAVAARFRRVDARLSGQGLSIFAVGVIACIFVLIALINLDFDPDRLIRRRKVGRFVGFDRRIQRDFFKNVALCRAMLAHDVASLAQRLGDCHAVRAGRHAADKHISVFVVFIDIKLHARNRIAVCAVGFGQADEAFCRLILDFQLAGFEVFLVNDDIRRKARVHEMLRHFAFRYAVGSPRQPAGFGNAVRIRRNDRDHLAVARSLMGWQTAEPRNGKLRACQQFFCELIPLNDPDPALNRLIARAQIRRFIRLHRRILLRQLRYIARRVFMLAHGILSLEQCGRRCRAVCIRGHCADNIAARVHDIELHALNRSAVQCVGLDDLDKALRRLVFDLDEIGLSVFRAVDFG